MIPAEVSTANSILEKPLNQLTEDDIGQITREECRRFLKERGMRRPSWNKSQAIQQVISLKALLADSTDPASFTTAIRIHQKPPNPTYPPLLSQSHSSLPSSTEPSGGGDLRSARTPAEEPFPYRRKDPVSPAFTVGDVPHILHAAFRQQLPSERLRPSPRTISDDQTGQLTLFYGGKVNVYEGVPSDKAREIFQLAATHDHFDASTIIAPSDVVNLSPFPPSYTGSVIRETSSDPGSQLTSAEGKLQRSFKDGLDERRASREPQPECPMSRNASLKRYLEKRKERYKGRRMIEGSSSSSMELSYLSQKQSAHAQNELLSRSNSSQAMQPTSPYQPPSWRTSFKTTKLETGEG